MPRKRKPGRPLNVGFQLPPTSTTINHRPQYDTADSITLETTPLCPAASVALTPDEFEHRIEQYRILAEQGQPLAIHPRRAVA